MNSLNSNLFQCDKSINNFEDSHTLEWWDGWKFSPDSAPGHNNKPKNNKETQSFSPKGSSFALGVFFRFALLGQLWDTATPCTCIQWKCWAPGWGCSGRLKACLGMSWELKILWLQPEDSKWVFPNIGVVNPQKWMVYFMENPIKMDDLGGTIIFWKHLSQQLGIYFINN